MATPGKLWSVIGLVLCMIAMLKILISFSTPYWVGSAENKIQVTHLEKIGLWEACFNGYSDVHEGAGRVYNGCAWMFDRAYSSMRRWLLPSWFVTAQALMTCNVVLSLLNSIFGVVLILGCLPQKARKWATAALALSHYTIGLFTIIACVNFGTHAETDRNWLVSPTYRRLGWSFYLAIFGGAVALLSAMCYSVFFIYVRKSGHNATAYRAHEMRHYRDRSFNY